VTTLNKQLPPITSFSRSLPPGRIRQFMRVAGHDPVRAQALHDWNEQIGSALFRPLQKFELALRARIPSAFEAVYGPDWYQDPGFRKKSDPGDRNSIAESIKRLMSDGLPVDAESIMSKAPFGLCVGSCARSITPPCGARSCNAPFLPFRRARGATASPRSRRTPPGCATASITMSPWSSSTSL
jgi:hypothetical protein